MRAPFIRRIIAGFSMVELLVTLVLLGLIASFVVPGVDSWLTSREAAATRMAINSKLALLPMQANRRGKHMLIDSAEQLALEDLALSVSFTQPVLVLANGYCQGGAFSLKQNNRTFYFDVLAPYCQVKRSKKTQSRQQASVN